MKSDPDNDWMKLDGSQVEWKELKVPPSLEDFALPDLPQVVAAAEKADIGEMAWWKAVLWTLLFLFVSQVVPAVLLTFGSLVFDGGETAKALADIANPTNPAVSKALFQFLAIDQILSLVFAISILRWKLGRDWKRKIALRLPSLDHAVLVCVALPALLLFNIALEGIVSRYIPNLNEIATKLKGGEVSGITSVEGMLTHTRNWEWFMAVLVIGLGPALSEELWCRGFLGRGLLARYGFWPGILITSFLFGMMHLEPPQAVMAMMMGMVLHVCYAATRSILVPMLLHLLNNGFAVLSISETGHFPLANSLEATYTRVPFLFLLAGGLVLATIGLALFQSRYRIISFSDGPRRPGLDIPERGGDDILLREPIPPGTVVLVVTALAAFASVWWNM